MTYYIRDTMKIYEIFNKYEILTNMKHLNGCPKDEKIKAFIFLFLNVFFLGWACISGFVVFCSCCLLVLVFFLDFFGGEECSSLSVSEDSEEEDDSFWGFLLGLSLLFLFIWQSSCSSSDDSRRGARLR